MTPIRAIVILAAVLTLLAACERSPQTAAPAAAAAALPRDFFLPSEPTGVRNVKDAKGTARKGDQVVIRGTIGGGEEPFTAARAVFTIVDPGVKSCADMGEDHCATPWDYCCEPRESIVASSATIQVVGADGRPLKADLKGVRGLEPLADVYVVGTVAQRDDGGTFVVNADGVWIKPKG
jgi:hypothetical protein